MPLVASKSHMVKVQNGYGVHLLIAFKEFPKQSSLTFLQLIQILGKAIFKFIY